MLGWGEEGAEDQEGPEDQEIRKGRVGERERLRDRN